MKRRLAREIPLDPETATISIIGSGLAGLATALSLERIGFRHVSIFERDESFGSRKEGYGLTLTYDPLGVLQQLRILEDVANEDCPSRSHYLFNEKGEILGYFGKAFSSNRVYGQRGNMRVPRQKVRQILISKLSVTKICWGRKLAQLEKVPLSGKTRLVFEQGEVVECDLVVAADGIWSTVVQKWLPMAPPPQSLGVRLILGLTTAFQHPLVHERGFYTLAEGVRLFVMPFSSPNVVNTDTALRYMWQLSIRSDMEMTTGNWTAEYLREEALRITKDWHRPVAEMIHSTPAASIWGAALKDRDPAALLALLLRRQDEFHERNEPAPKILIVGDALHAMSPFKGQGANQSLADGLTIAKWLPRASPNVAVKCAMREIVQRTAPVVRASRKAAEYWHSSDALKAEHKFACDVDGIISHLSNLTAETLCLDDRIGAIVLALKKGHQPDIVTGRSEQAVEDCISKNIVDAASTADLGRLREISWRTPNILRIVDAKESLVCCAAKTGDWRVVLWLIVEAGCQIRKTAIDVAGNEKVGRVLEYYSTSKV